MRQKGTKAKGPRSGTKPMAIIKKKRAGRKQVNPKRAAGVEAEPEGKMNPEPEKEREASVLEESSEETSEVSRCILYSVYLLSNIHNKYIREHNTNGKPVWLDLCGPRPDGYEFPLWFLEVENKPGWF